MKLKLTLVLFISIIVFVLVFFSVGMYIEAQSEDHEYMIDLDEHASILVSTEINSPKVWINNVGEENNTDLEYISLTEQMNDHYPDFAWDEMMKDSYSSKNLVEIDNLAATYICTHCSEGKGFMSFEGLVRSYEMGETVSDEKYDEYIMTRYSLEYGVNFTQYDTQNGPVGVLLDRYRSGIHVVFLYPHQESKRVYAVTGLIYSFILGDEAVMDSILQALTSLTFTGNEYSDELYHLVDTTEWKAIVPIDGA